MYPHFLHIPTPTHPHPHTHLHRFFRDIVYLFKALLAPSSDSLPDLRPWRARDAALTWAYKNDGGFVVRGFGGKLKCAAFVKPEDLVNKGGFLTRLKGMFGLNKPRWVCVCVCVCVCGSGE